jgi:hypothetical protein
LYHSLFFVFHKSSINVLINLQMIDKIIIVGSMIGIGVVHEKVEGRQI